MMKDREKIERLKEEECQEAGWNEEKCNSRRTINDSCLEPNSSRLLKGKKFERGEGIRE